MRIEWNKVTWYSKLLAAIVFVATFAIAFYLGRIYQMGVEADERVKRLFSNKVPEASGEFCGGIAAIPCPSGFECRLDGNYPDAGGTCVPD